MTTILNMLSYLASIFLSALLAFLAVNAVAHTVGIHVAIPTDNFVIAATIAWIAQQVLHRDTRKSRHAPARDQ